MHRVVTIPCRAEVDMGAVAVGTGLYTMEDFAADVRNDAPTAYEGGILKVLVRQELWAAWGRPMKIRLLGGDYLVVPTRVSFLNNRHAGCAVRSKGTWTVYYYGRVTV